MSSKTISVTVPEEMLPEIDQTAHREHRSRAALVREALRRYLASAPGREIALENAEPDEMDAIRKGRAQFHRGDFVRLDDLQRELGLPTR
ncbi:MAG TPA: ribbon-helix-helix domain-containing protein [Stellaceae bacterium]|nr:ribbon-helix-helix domain-containing protein [Stellaceae bacterium]